MSKIRRSSVCSSPRRDNNNNSCGVRSSSASDSSSNETTNFNLNKSKLISHGDFLNRVKKSLYYGRARVSVPLSDYIADAFSDTHKTYSLNRLDYATIGQLRTTPCSLILAMIYLERLKDADPAYSKHITPTELFLVSMMVATKFYSGHDEDSSVDWAEFAKMTPDNLLRMELEFLSALDWKVYVSNEEFFKKVESIERKLARKQGMRRGWFTYMELDSLMPSIQITKSFLHFTFIIGLSYTAFVATIVASVFLVSQIPGTYLNASSRRATVSEAIASISIQQTTATHSPIVGNDADNSSQTMTEYHNNGDNLPSVMSDIIEKMETDLLQQQSAERLADKDESNATKRNGQNSESAKYDAAAKREEFKWSVIFNSLTTEKHKTGFYIDRTGHTISQFNSNGAASGVQHFTDNSTIFDSIVFQPNSAAFRNYFHGIKMTFA